MLAFLLAPFYIALNAYILTHSLKWLDACFTALMTRPLKVLWSAVFLFFTLLPLTSFLLPASKPQRFLAWLSSFWLGFLLYLCLLILVADGLSRLLLHFQLHWLKAMDASLCRALTGSLLIICAAAICAGGVLHASDLKVTRYEMTLDKSCGNRDSLRIVLAADFHLGYSVGARQMERMVDLINRQNADLVCFAGDEFDNTYTAIDDPAGIADTFSKIRSTYGVYACYGNHDVDERLLAGLSVSPSPSLTSDPRMDQLLEAGGVKLLRDESVLIDDSFYLIGRRDASKAGLSGDRASIEALLHRLPASPTHKQTLPIVVIDHQPRELDRLEKAGVDLTLSGHTHNGQIFPANLLVHAAWENPCGLLKKGSLHSIVTSGVGVWGPNMRVLTDSEIVVIDVFF